MANTGIDTTTNKNGNGNAGASVLVVEIGGQPTSDLQSAVIVVVVVQRKCLLCRFQKKVASCGTH